MEFMDKKGRLDKVRQGLKNAEDIELPMSEDFYERLHDKIMFEVERTEIAPRRYVQRNWKAWLYPIGGITSLVLIAALVIPQMKGINQSMKRAGLASDGQEIMAKRALDAPEELGQTLITSQSDADFFIDVAADSFENLSIAQFNKIMGESVH